MRNRQFDGVDPEPIRGRLREPGYVLRFRKERSFIYPLAVREEDERASPTMEAVAQTQAMACGRPRPVVVVAPIGPGCSDTLRAGTAFRSTSGSWVGLPHSFPSTAESFRG